MFESKFKNSRTRVGFITIHPISDCFAHFRACLGLRPFSFVYKDQQSTTTGEQPSVLVLGLTSRHLRYAATLMVHWVDARYAVQCHAMLASHRHMRTVDFELILCVKITSCMACRQKGDNFNVLDRPFRQTSLSTPLAQGKLRLGLGGKEEREGKGVGCSNEMLIKKDLKRKKLTFLTVLDCI